MGDNISMNLCWRSTIWDGLLSVLLCLSLAGTVQGETVANTPLSLQDALDIALQQHPILRVGQADIEAARQRVWQETAGYLPRGAYTYRFMREEIPVTTAVGGIEADDIIQRRTTSQTFNFHRTNFRMSQLLFDFGRTLHAIRSAVADVDASRSDLETLKQTVIFNTKQAYYSLLSTQRLLKVGEETVRQNTQLLEEAQARLEVGLAPRFDVTQSQVQLSNAQLNLVIAKNNVALSHETLRTALGSPQPLTFSVEDTLDRRSFTFDAETILQLAYASRSELRSIQAQQRMTAERVASLQKQYLPSVSGDAQYNWTGREHPLQDGWQLGVTLTFPLFNDIRTIAQVGEVQANLRRLKAEEENLRLKITLEVRRSLLTLRQAEESIRVNEQTVVQAQENTELAEGRYTAGVGNIIEVTDAQVSLTSARANQIHALYTFKTALADLERATGKALE